MLASDQRDCSTITQSRPISEIQSINIKGARAIVVIRCSAALVSREAGAAQAAGLRPASARDAATRRASR